MPQTIDRLTGTDVLSPSPDFSSQLLPTIPKNHVAVMTDEGLKVSTYAVGQWVKYGDRQTTGRIGGIRWDDAEPVMSDLLNHWTGEWFLPSFVYKVYDTTHQEDLTSWEDVAEDDITGCLGDAQIEDYEKIRKYKLEQQLLINIVTRCLKEKGGQLPELYFSRVALSVSWDEPAYKVGMHVRWENKPSPNSKERTTSGTGIILGVERCINEEPGFWVYRLQGLTGDKCSEGFDFAEHEIVEVLRSLDGDDLALAFQWSEVCA